MDNHTYTTTTEAKTQVFLGEYLHTLDSKGRIALPTKFRSQLGEEAVVTRGLDGCLFLYPTKEWHVLADRLAKLPLAQATTRAFVRLMLAGAMAVTIDRQGRMMVPDYLRRYANLKRKVVLTGLFNRLELWDAEAWEAYRHSTEQESGAIAEAMANLGV